MVIVIAIKGHPQLEPGHRLGQIEALPASTISLGTINTQPGQGAVGGKEGQPIAVVKLHALGHLTQLNPVAAALALAAGVQQGTHRLTGILGA